MKYSWKAPGSVLILLALMLAASCGRSRTRGNADGNTDASNDGASGSLNSGSGTSSETGSGSGSSMGECGGQSDDTPCGEEVANSCSRSLCQNEMCTSMFSDQGQVCAFENDNSTCLTGSCDGMGACGVQANKQLVSTFAHNKFQAGNMFDIKVLTSIRMESIDVNLSKVPHNIEIYYRPGSFVGHTTSPDGWQPLGSATVAGNGRGVATPVPLALNLELSPGTHALYVTTDAKTSTNYASGNGVGTVISQDAFLQIKEGNGGTYFSVDIPNRRWNGTIHYKVCN